MVRHCGLVRVLAIQPYRVKGTFRRSLDLSWKNRKRMSVVEARFSWQRRERVRPDELPAKSTYICLYNNAGHESAGHVGRIVVN